MLVGLLSDSHGDGPMTARAIALLEARGAKKLFHCGDICGETVLDELAGHDCIFVWGNCDAPSAGMKRYVAAIGLPVPHGPIILELAGRQIAVFHGHEREFRQAAQGGGFDYIFYGHTHVYADERIAGTRLINPGALHRAAVKTVAMLDLTSEKLRFFRVDNGTEISAPS